MTFASISPFGRGMVRALLKARAGLCFYRLTKVLMRALLHTVLAMTILAAAPAMAYEHDEATNMMEGVYDGEIYLKIKRFNAENFGEWPIYAEYRMGGKDQPVSRQRVYAFGWQFVRNNFEDRVPIGMAYDFPDGQPYIGAAEDPSKLDGLLMSDLSQFPIDCMLYGSKEGDTYILKTKDDLCRVDNPEHGVRQVDLRMTFSPDGMTIDEVGYDLDGNRLFGTTEPITLTRVSPDPETLK